MDAFLKSGQQILEELRVDGKNGLSSQQANAHAQKYGVNAFSRQKRESFLKKVLVSLKEPMIFILMIAAFITVAVNVVQYIQTGHGDFVECIGIFVAIFLSVSITVLMEGRSEKAFDALNRIKEDIRVRVVRDGRVCEIMQNEIVVGDIVLIETGDKIPADGRLLESSNLYADESALTGESVPAKKDASAQPENPKTPVAERCNMLYSGCFITGGSGRMVVTGVGDHTEFGSIARELSQADGSRTPIQEKLARLGKTITALGSVVAGAVFLIQLVKIILAGDIGFAAVSDAFITSIVLIVAAVPEGLPTIVAISLAINMMKMSRQNALVKKLVACETIGCINVICSDKTGTLTQNRMTVTQVYEDGALKGTSQICSPYLRANICCNSTANLEQRNGDAAFIGNPTECAMLVAYEASRGDGAPYADVRAAARIAHVYSFSSETKRMTTVLEQNDGYLAYCKGSPEKILAQCSHIQTDGEARALTESDRSAIEAHITSFQKQACRVLALCHKALTGTIDFENERGAVESDMVYDGFVVITDPLRADVYDAVSRCKAAGIEVKMLTGDNIVTAAAIAAELQILDDDHIAVEASELEELSDVELKKVLPRVRVIARSTPVIKMRVVKALKEMGEVVAVTGDGINDAPAIKNADVGIAMGVSGTEVSKEASDIILLDDSFSTIVRAVHWGRGIYENFRRFIQFQLTVNVSSVIVVLFSVLLGMKAPFTALQLLWINIIMDGPPALTLGLESIRSGLMQKAPTRRSDNIVNRQMAMRIALSGAYITVVFLLQSAWNFLGATPQQTSSVLFTLFVLFQLFNAFNARELDHETIFRRFGSNRPMILVFAATFALQVVITQFGGSVFNTAPLPLLLWVKIFVTAFSVVLVSELVKLVWRVVLKIGQRQEV